MILPHEHFIGRVGSEIERRQYVVLLYSEEASASRWVKAEIAWALHWRKPIIAVLLTRTVSFIDFFFLLDVPMVDYSRERDRQSAIRHLVALLQLPPEPLYIPPEGQGPRALVFSKENLRQLEDSISQFSISEPEKSLFIYRTLLESDAADETSARAIENFAQHLRSERLSRLYGLTRNAVTIGDWHTAGHLANEILRVDPDDSYAAYVCRICYENPICDPLYDHAINAARDGEWEAVKPLMRSIRQRCPNYGDPVGLLVVRPESAYALQQQTILLSSDKVRERTTRSSHTTPLCLAFFADGSQLASGWSDGFIRFRGLSSKSKLTTMEGLQGQIVGLSMSAGGAFLVSAERDRDSSGSVTLWRLPHHSNDLIEPVIEHCPVEGSIATCVAISPDKKLLAAGVRSPYGLMRRLRNHVKIWFMPGHREYDTFHIPNTEENLTNFVTFSPNGRLLATDLGSPNVYLWDSYVRKDVLTMVGHQNEVVAGAFSPDGKLLATASLDTTVRLWRVETGEPFAVLHGHTAPVRSLAFNKDGTVLLSGGDDYTIKLWYVPMPQEIHTLRGHTNSVRSLALSPDNNVLVSASTDGTIRLWGLI